MSKTGTTEKPDPWRVPVAVVQIPETGLHRDIEADQAVRNAVADVGGLREVLSVQASFDVTPVELVTAFLGALRIGLYNISSVALKKHVHLAGSIVSFSRAV